MGFNHTKNTIAITDAFSLTGPAIVRELLSHNYKIQALVKTASNIPEEWLSHPGLRLIRGDIWDPLSLENLMKGASAVIHTAQFFSLQKKDKKRMRSVQIEGTAQVVNSALKNNVSKFVHISSTEALGHGNQIDGDGPRLKWLDDEDYSLFGRTAFHAELEGWRGQAEGLSVVILRPSFLIKAHRESNPIADWLNQVIKGVSFFPTGSAGWVDVEDLAKAARLSLTRDLEQKAWVISSENHSYKSIIDCISTIRGRRAPIKAWPTTFSPFLSFWNRISDYWGGGASWLSSDSLELSNIHSKYDGAKAAQKLGFEYRPVKKSLAQWVEAKEHTGWEQHLMLLPHQ